MRKRVAGLIGAAAAIALIAAPSATAAVEFGDTCAGDDIAPPPTEYTLTTLVSPGGALPLVAPNAGVITQLKLRIAEPLPLGVPSTIKALRAAGGNLFTVVGEAPITAGPSVATAGARIAVQAFMPVAMSATVTPGGNGCSPPCACC